MEQISRFEIVRGDRPNQPSPADVASGLAAMRACRGILEPLSVPVRATVTSTIVAEFLTLWGPDELRSVVLRQLLAGVHSCVASIDADPPPPDSAA